MDALGEHVVLRLAKLGVQVSAHSVDTAQVQFTAGETASPDATRVVLGIDATHVRAGLELPATQARAALARLADPARALELATALEALPEQFTVGPSSDRGTVEAPRASADHLRALFNRVERAGDTVWIGWAVPRELALEHAESLDEQLEDAIAALAQLFSLLVADGPSDAAGAHERRRFSGRRGNEDGKGNGKGDDEAERDRRETAARTRGRSREREHESERESESEPEPPREAPYLAARRPELKGPARPGARRRPLKTMQPAIERGSRVSVLKGPFSGKVGVVHELDGKGGARVMLGLLAVRLEVKNLMPCVGGRGRPVLSSSHRKPIPARS